MLSVLIAVRHAHVTTTINLDVVVTIGRAAWKGSSPTINTYHNYTRNIETNTARDDRVRWCKIERARRKLLAVLVLEHERLVGTVKRERDRHEGYKASEYPDDGDGGDGDAPGHPASVPTAVGET